MTSEEAQANIIIQGLIELLSCGKCQKSPERPVRYVTCGHFFCDTCILGDSICFRCKIPVKANELQPYRMVAQLVEYCRMTEKVIATTNIDDSKVLGKAVKRFVAEIRHTVVPETDSESESDLVESTPPRRLSRETRSRSRAGARTDPSKSPCPKEKNVEEESAGFVDPAPFDKSFRGKPVEPETAGCGYSTRKRKSMGKEIRLENAEPETAGYVDPTPFPNKKRNFSPRGRALLNQSFRAEFSSPETSSPVDSLRSNKKECQCELKTADCFRCWYSSLQRKSMGKQLTLEDAEPEFAGYVDPSPFPNKKRNFSPRGRALLNQSFRAEFSSPETRSPIDSLRSNKKECQSELKTADCGYSPRQRKSMGKQLTLEDAEPEFAGYVDPTPFPNKKVNFSPRGRALLNQSFRAEFSSPETRSPIDSLRSNKKECQSELKTADCGYSPRQRKSMGKQLTLEDAEPEFAGYVDPTPFPNKKVNFSPRGRALLNQSFRAELSSPETRSSVDSPRSNRKECQSEPETAGFVDPTQTPKSHTKKSFSAKTCQFLKPTAHPLEKNFRPELASSAVVYRSKPVIGKIDSQPESVGYVETSQINIRPRRLIQSDVEMAASTHSQICKKNSQQENVDSPDTDENSSKLVQFMTRPRSKKQSLRHAEPESVENKERENVSNTKRGLVEKIHQQPESSENQVYENPNEKNECAGINRFSEKQLSERSKLLANESLEMDENISTTVVIPESPQIMPNTACYEDSPMEIDRTCMKENDCEKAVNAPDKVSLSSDANIDLGKKNSQNDEAITTLEKLSDTVIERKRKSTETEMENCAQKKVSSIREKTPSDADDFSAESLRRTPRKLRRRSRNSLEKKSNSKVSNIETGGGPTIPRIVDSETYLIDEYSPVRTVKRSSRIESISGMKNRSSIDQQANSWINSKKNTSTLDSELEKLERNSSTPQAKRFKGMNDSASHRNILKIDQEIPVSPITPLDKTPRTEETGSQLKSMESLEDQKIDNSKDEKVEDLEVQKVENLETKKLEKSEKMSKETPINPKTPRRYDNASPGIPKVLPQNVNKRNAKGETALHVACVKGQTEYVKMLLQAGANPNTKDNANWTPLQEAVNLGHLEICESLLQAGASANTPAMENRTALHDAVANDRLAAAALLLRFNAKKNVYDKFGKAPIEYAKSDEMRSLLTDETELEKTIQENPCRIDALDQTIVVPREKIVVCRSNLKAKNRQLLSKLASKLNFKIVTSFRLWATYVVVETNERNLTKLSYDVMQAILHGKWILNSQCEGITISTDLNDISEIDLEMFEVLGVPHPGTPACARLNKEKQNPGLFNNCFFYFALGLHKTWSYEKFEFEKEDLASLVHAGQGEILNREPDPEDVEDYKLTPFHVADKPIHPLHRCCHYIIYMPGNEEPRVKYNMPHIKTLPLGWFFECIEKFTLVDPALMGIL